MDKKPPVEDSKRPPASRGERIFDWLVYGGIAGIGVFLATIPTTYWAKYGGGAKYFKRGSHKLESLGLSAKTAEDMMMSTALMQGGNLAVFPVKWAEDNKVAMVTKINDMIGEKTDIAALENEDRQTWGSILKARVAAWLTVFTGFKIVGHTVGSGKLAAFEESFAKNVCGMLGKATHMHGQETKIFRHGKIAALDVFATAASSTLLYVGSRVFAHWERQRTEAVCANAAPDIPAHSENDAMPTSQAAQKILASKAPAKDFASAALASRTGELLQLGA